MRIITAVLVAITAAALHGQEIKPTFKPVAITEMQPTCPSGYELWRHVGGFTIFPSPKEPARTVEPRDEWYVPDQDNQEAALFCKKSPTDAELMAECKAKQDSCFGSQPAVSNEADGGVTWKNGEATGFQPVVSAEADGGVNWKNGEATSSLAGAEVVYSGSEFDITNGPQTISEPTQTSREVKPPSEEGPPDLHAVVWHVLVVEPLNGSGVALTCDDMDEDQMPIHCVIHSGHTLDEVMQTVYRQTLAERHLLAEWEASKCSHSSR